VLYALVYDCISPNSIEEPSFAHLIKKFHCFLSFCFFLLHFSNQDLHALDFAKLLVRRASLPRRHDLIGQMTEWYVCRYAGTQLFELRFPSAFTCEKMYASVTSLLQSSSSSLPLHEPLTSVLRYEFELDQHNQRVLLGKGSFGAVYSAMDLDRKISVCLVRCCMCNLYVSMYCIALHCIVLHDGCIF
jgi:hypothetical protein